MDEIFENVSWNNNPTLKIRYGPLLQQLKEMQKTLHNPPRWSDTEVLVTNGSQDGLCKALEMMVNENDHVLLQEPVYAGTLAIVCQIFHLRFYHSKFKYVLCDHPS